MKHLFLKLLAVLVLLVGVNNSDSQGSATKPGPLDDAIALTHAVALREAKFLGADRAGLPESADVANATVLSLLKNETGKLGLRSDELEVYVKKCARHEYYLQRAKASREMASASLTKLESGETEGFNRAVEKAFQDHQISLSRDPLANAIDAEEVARYQAWITTLSSEDQRVWSGIWRRSNEAQIAAVLGVTRYKVSQRAQKLKAAFVAEFGAKSVAIAAEMMVPRPALHNALGDSAKAASHFLGNLAKRSVVVGENAVRHCPSLVVRALGLAAGAAAAGIAAAAAGSRKPESEHPGAISSVRHHPPGVRYEES